MQSTEWRPIPGYEGCYEASELGEIRSVRAHPKGRHGPNHVLKPQQHRNGYLNVGLRKDGTRKVIGVHRLVASAFFGTPGPHMEARHADGDPSNNAVSNLSWGTHSENELDKAEHGTQYSHFRGKEACTKGHVYTEATVYRHAGRRHCRVCNHDRYLARKNP